MNAVAEQDIVLPFNWTPRWYQEPLWNYFIRGGKRGVAVWHRRAGKDTEALHLECAMTQLKPANYWHMFPIENQARRAIWNGVNPHSGKRILSEIFPGFLRPGTGLVKRTHSQEMLVEFKNGAMWNLVGSDNYDRLVGSPPYGVVFSEWALANPAAWEFIRPILLENGGWALFIYTPRGHNHGFRLYDMAKRNPDWYCELLTVDDTGVFTSEQIDTERREGMAETTVQQEYYCSFDAPIEGAYYGDQMIKADKEGRITTVPHEPQLPVETWWDLGIGDLMSIWFVQRHGPQVRCIRYYENNGFGLDHYINYMWKLRDEQGYLFGQHYAPHDIEVRELGTGKSRKEVARDLGVDFTTAPKLPVDDGINAVRSALSQFWFDEDNCARGIDALRSYQKEEDEIHSDGVVKFYRDKPLHNWASHGADAARTGITGHRAPLGKEPIKYKDSGVPA